MTGKDHEKTGEKIEEDMFYSMKNDSAVLQKVSSDNDDESDTNIDRENSSLT